MMEYVTRLIVCLTACTPLWHLWYRLEWSKYPRKFLPLDNRVQLVVEAVGGSGSESMLTFCRQNGIRVGGRTHQAWPIIWARLHGVPVLVLTRRYRDARASVMRRWPQYYPWPLFCLRYCSIMATARICRARILCYPDYMSDVHDTVQNLTGINPITDFPRIATQQEAST